MDAVFEAWKDKNAEIAEYLQPNPENEKEDQ